MGECLACARKQVAEPLRSAVRTEGAAATSLDFTLMLQASRADFEGKLYARQ